MISATISRRCHTFASLSFLRLIIDSIDLYLLQALVNVINEVHYIIILYRKLFNIDIIRFVLILIKSIKNISCFLRLLITNLIISTFQISDAFSSSSTFQTSLWENWTFIWGSKATEHSLLFLEFFFLLFSDHFKVLSFL